MDISTAAELYNALASQGTDLLVSSIINITDDIDMSGYECPIHSASNTNCFTLFEGNGHTISNLHNTCLTSNGVIITANTIQNIHLVDVNFNSTGRIIMLEGINNGFSAQILNSSITGCINGTEVWLFGTHHQVSYQTQIKNFAFSGRIFCNTFQLASNTIGERTPWARAINIMLTGYISAKEIIFVKKSSESYGTTLSNAMIICNISWDRLEKDIVIGQYLNTANNKNLYLYITNQNQLTTPTYILIQPNSINVAVFRTNNNLLVHTSATGEPVDTYFKSEVPWLINSVEYTGRIVKNPDATSPGVSDNSTLQYNSIFDLKFTDITLNAGSIYLSYNPRNLLEVYGWNVKPTIKTTLQFTNVDNQTSDIILETELDIPISSFSPVSNTKSEYISDVSFPINLIGKTANDEIIDISNKVFKVKQGSSSLAIKISHSWKTKGSLNCRNASGDVIINAGGNFRVYTAAQVTFLNFEQITLSETTRNIESSYTYTIGEDSEWVDNALYTENYYGGCNLNGEQLPDIIGVFPPTITELNNYIPPTLLSVPLNKKSIFFDWIRYTNDLNNGQNSSYYPKNPINWKISLDYDTYDYEKGHWEIVDDEIVWVVEGIEQVRKNAGFPWITYYTEYTKPWQVFLYVLFDYLFKDSLGHNRQRQSDDPAERGDLYNRLYYNSVLDEDPNTKWQVPAATPSYILDGTTSPPILGYTELGRFPQPVSAKIQQYDGDTVITSMSDLPTVTANLKNCMLFEG